MKEKITQFARGNYEYRGPGVILSNTEISMEVEQGISYYGSFSISSIDQMQIKGLVYSSCRLLQIIDEQFAGVDNSIRYKVRTEGLQIQDVVEGNLTCVTNRGEIVIPYHFTVVAPYCIVKDKPIKDLFQFTKLVKSDPLAAVTLFKSDAFKNVFLKKEAAYRSIYETLLRSSSASQAMEEFLIAIHKKSPVSIAVDKTELQYHGISESFMEKITIQRSTWGYLEIKISTDADFIQLDHKVLWTDNFVGDTYPLEIVVNPDKMRAGNNFGTIYLKTINQVLKIPVTCSCPHKEEISNHFKPRIRKYRIKLTKSYLAFRMNRMNLEEYIQETSSIVSSLAILEDDTLYDLVRTHLYIISGNHEMSKEMIDILLKRVEQSEHNALVYCAFQYLKAMYDKEEQTIEAAISSITEFFDRDNDYRYLWFLLHLDKRYDKNRTLKLKDIRTVCENGCKSPIMYYEACTVYNEDPTLMHELGPFEKQVINWGIKEKYLSEELVLQVASLSSREKKFTPIVYHMLVDLYEQKPSRDILFSICSILIKSEKTQNKYFKWYRLGVENQLKLTSLHEFYMYAIDEDEVVSLSHPIYLYYIYNSNLSDNKKAFLYAQIIKEKEQNESIYTSYEKQMERFLYRQLQLRQINKNLATIYMDLLPPEKISDAVAKDLSVLMFYYEITCYNPNIKGVSIVHKELKSEIYHPLKDGKAVVPIFTDHAQIFLVDTSDNRYYETVPYQIERLMQYDRYVDVCYVYEKSNSFLNMHLFEKIIGKQTAYNHLAGLYKSVIQIPNLQEWFYKKCIFIMITNGYDAFDGEVISQLVSQIDIKTLSEAERAEIMEFMIHRGMYEKVLESLSQFGCSLLAKENLDYLCMKLITPSTELNERLLYVAKEAFMQGNQQTEVIEYLLQYFLGTTQQMYRLYQSASKKKISTAKFEEQLLGQVLFSEVTNLDVSEVFLSYYNRTTEEKNLLLIDAYLGYFSFQYVLKDLVLNEKIIDCIKKEDKLYENLYYTLALLKFYSEQETLTKEEEEYVEFHVLDLMKKGIVLPFFQKFKDLAMLPELLFKKHFVMYRTNKEKKVWIHYTIDTSIEESKEGTKEPYTESMQEVFCGIYVKEFMLFCKEQVEYEIIEEGSEAVQASGTIKVSDMPVSVEAESEYDLINAMITASTRKDKEKVVDLVKQYVTLNYSVEELIRPL